MVAITFTYLQVSPAPMSAPMQQRAMNQHLLPMDQWGPRYPQPPGAQNPNAVPRQPMLQKPMQVCTCFHSFVA